MAKRAPKGLRILGWILRTLGTLVVFGVVAVIVWRLASSGDPAAVKSLIPNEPLAAAYAQYGDDLILRRQNQISITRAERNAGYFSVTRCVFIPQANQVQLVFRYNNSTLRHLKEDYDLDAIPPKSGVYFDVSLVKTTDLTPETKDDNLDPATLRAERILPSCEPKRAETGLYTYFRYTFDGVTVDDLTDGIYADIFYLDDLDYSREAYGTLCLYAYDSEWIPVKLTAADKKALGTYREG